jgi:hydrogenase nickel incorporation protein HypA/HybF
MILITIYSKSISGGATMHELSLMEGIISIVEQAARANNFTRVTTIHLVLGELTTAYPDALLAAFDAWAEEPLFSNTVLEIERVPISAICLDCGFEFHPDKIRFECPQCCSLRVEMGNGQEFFVDYIDGQ